MKECHLHYNFADNNGLRLPGCSSDGVIFIVVVLFAHLFCRGTYMIFVVSIYHISPISFCTVELF